MPVVAAHLSECNTQRRDITGSDDVSLRRTASPRRKDAAAVALTGSDKMIKPESFTLSLVRQNMSYKSAAINGCAFSPEPGKTIVAFCDERGAVILRNLNKPNNDDDNKGRSASLKFFRHSAKKDIAQCLSFSSDGKMLAVAGGKVDDVGTAARVRVYVTDQKDDEPEINRLVKAYHAEHLVTDISFAPSGEIAYGGLNQPLRIVQGPTSPELKSAQTRTLRLDPQTTKPIQLEDVPVGGNEEADKCSLVEQKRADASADPPANASSRPGGGGRIRRSSSRMPPSSPASSDTDPEAKDEEDDNDDMLFSIQFSPCGRYLAVVEKHAVLTVFARTDRRIPSERFSAFGRLRAVSEPVSMLGGSRNLDSLHDHDGPFFLPDEPGWTKAEKRQILYKRAESADMRSTVVAYGSCRFSAQPDDGRPMLIALALMDNRLIVREAETGDLRYIIKGSTPACGVAFSHAQRMLLAVAMHEGVQVYDAFSGARAHTFEDVRVNTVCFSPSGYALAYGTAVPGKSHSKVMSLRIDAGEMIVTRPPTIRSIVSFDRHMMINSKLNVGHQFDIAPHKPRLHRTTSGRSVPIERSKHFPVASSHRGSFFGPLALRKQNSEHSKYLDRMQSAQGGDPDQQSFKCAAVAVSGKTKKVVVACVTETGQLVITPPELDRKHKIRLLEKLPKKDGKTRWAVPTCLALKYDDSERDVKNRKMFLAYEELVEDKDDDKAADSEQGMRTVSTPFKSKLVVLDVTDPEEPKEFDCKEAAHPSVRFSRVDFSKRCNTLVCYTAAGHLAA